MEHFEFFSKVFYLGKPIFANPANPNRFCVVHESQIFIYDSEDEFIDEIRKLLKDLK